MKRIGVALCFISEQGPQVSLTEDNQSTVLVQPEVKGELMFCHVITLPASETMKQ